MTKPINRPRKTENYSKKRERFNEMEEIIVLMYRRGFTDKEVSKAIGITEQCMAQWMAKEPKRFEALKSGKLCNDELVEMALRDRAMGCSINEEQLIFKDGEPQVVTIKKYYPPDATSMIFWLKNRQPERWRDKPKEAGDDSGDAALKMRLQIAEMMGATDGTSAAMGTTKASSGG